MKKNVHLGVLSLLVGGAAWALGATACGDDDVTPVAPTDGGADGPAVGADTGSGLPPELLPDDLEIKTYASDPKGIYVNSHLIFGKTNAALVDGQYFKADAEKVVELIKSTNRTLKYVILTHAHPDHYLGFKVIKDAFPGARFVSAEPVAAAYNASAQATFDAIKAQQGAAVADGIVPLEGLKLVSAIDVPPHSPIDLDGNPLRLYMQKFPGDAGTLLVVSLTEKRVITGDMIFNKAHLYLAECTLGDEGWKGNLAGIAPFLWNDFYPGHGPSPAKFDAVAENVKYIDTATAILREAAGWPHAGDAGPGPVDAGEDADAGVADADAGAQPGAVESAMAKIKTAFPDYQGDALLELSTRGYIEGTPATGGKTCK